MHEQRFASGDKDGIVLMDWQGQECNNNPKESQRISGTAEYAVNSFLKPFPATPSTLGCSGSTEPGEKRA